MLKYRLVYFNSRGPAELIRYIFAYIGHEYEDFRIEESEWPSYKNRTIFGNLPVLEISDGIQSIQLAQTMSIARYLAALNELVGKTDIERARADMICEQLNDILEIYYKVRMEHDLEIRIEKETFFFKETLMFYASMFERFFEVQKTTHVAANELTYADLAFAVFWDTFGEKKAMYFESCVVCKTMYDRVNHLPEIVEWKQKRPITPI
nr:glutathione S-transferase sigma 8 [Brachionus rubens]